MHRRLLLFPILLVFWLGLACSDGGNVATAPPSAPSAAGSAVAGQVRAQLAVDFTGAPTVRAKVTRALTVAPGTKAWDAIKASVGETNLSTQSFGDLGIFITGFYGVQAQGNHFWEFRVNGTGSEAGVSTYVVKDGDSLEFRYSSY